MPEYGPHEEDELLTAAETAALREKTPGWRHEWGNRLPFTRRLGRAVRFDRAGLLAWMEEQADPL